MISTNILLGAVAGVTIFLGLLIARWRNANERVRGLLEHGQGADSVYFIDQRLDGFTGPDNYACFRVNAVEDACEDCGGRLPDNP